MDVRQFLIVNIVALSSAAMLLAIAQSGLRRSAAWVLVNGLVVAAGLLALFLALPWMDWLAAGVFSLFVMAPAVLGLIAQRSLLGGHLSAAAACMRGIAWLHPTPASRLNAAVVQAQALPDSAGQIAALQRLRTAASPAQTTMIDAIIKRVENDWDGLLTLIGPDGVASRDLGLLALRALGEVGRADDLAKSYEAMKSRLSGNELLQAQLFVLAFGGRPQEAALLLDGPLAALPAEAKAYWKAIALRCSGEPVQAWQPPLRLMAFDTADTYFKASATRQLSLPGYQADAILSEAGAAIVMATATRVRRTVPVRQNFLLAYPMTALLLVAVVAMYAVEEMLGGAEDLKVLTTLGAMWPPYVVRRGEWWRLATALFVHFGPLHAGVNALMLFAIGRLCEQLLGSLRLLAIFMLGGAASCAFVLWTMQSGYAQTGLLMGASGAIMALLGGVVAHRLVQWWRDRDVLDRRALLVMPGLLVLQIAADLAVPQVSLAAHASGFVAGFLICLILAATRRRPR